MNDSLLSVKSRILTSISLRSGAHLQLGTTAALSLPTSNSLTCSSLKAVMQRKIVEKAHVLSEKASEKAHELTERASEKALEMKLTAKEKVSDIRARYKRDRTDRSASLRSSECTFYNCCH